MRDALRWHATARTWWLEGAADDVPSAALQAEAMAVLDRLAGRDPEARRRYAEVAQREGWPCYGLSWREWAAEVA